MESCANNAYSPDSEDGEIQFILSRPSKRTHNISALGTNIESGIVKKNTGAAKEEELLSFDRML